MVIKEYGELLGIKAACIGRRNIGMDILQSAVVAAATVFCACFLFRRKSGLSEDPEEGCGP